MSPEESEDLTEVIRRADSGFVLLRSPDTAEHAPDYEEVLTFPTLKLAEAYLDSGSSSDRDVS
jgi:hypothetical protein